MALSRNNSTTFFARLANLTKAVGRMTARCVRARQQRILQKSSRALFFYARRVKNAKRVYERLLLKRREKRSNLQERYYQNSVTAARNQLFAERMECMKHWRILERRDALPIDPLSRKRWSDFDEFLRWQDAKDRKVKTYA